MRGDDVPLSEDALGLLQRASNLARTRGDPELAGILTELECLLVPQPGSRGATP